MGAAGPARADACGRQEKQRITARGASQSTITVTVFQALCATTSVALGAIYMFAAGAPRFYIAVNAAALAAGVTAASLMRRRPVRNQTFAGACAVAIGLVLLATAVFGLHIDGASRWVRVAGIALQPSLILLPPAIVHFASDRGWLSSTGLVIAGLALGLQPDRAMAGALAIGLAALWLHRREAPVVVALAAAGCGFVATLLSVDVVAPVAFVERVVQSAFAFDVVTGLATVAGLAAMLVPAAGFDGRTGDREVLTVFGATWLTVIAFAVIGNYPTPLVGYGSSAILGYCLSAAAGHSRAGVT
jgi:cell division protein FtsW (lipid II flippase)